MAFIRAAQEHGLPYVNDLNGKASKEQAFTRRQRIMEKELVHQELFKISGKEDKLTLKLGTSEPYYNSRWPRDWCCLSREKWP